MDIGEDDALDMDAADLMVYGAGLALAVSLGALIASGAFRSDAPRPARSWKVFILGEGGWRAWHLLLSLSLLVFAVGLAVVWYATADELFIGLAILGVSGGALLLMTLVDGIVWVSRAYESSRWMRFIVGPGMVLIAWLALLVLFAVYLQFIAFVLVDSIVGPVVTLLFASAVFVLNLLAIRGFRG